LSRVAIISECTGIDIIPYSFFLLTSSLFFIADSFFLILSSLFFIADSFFLIPYSLFLIISWFYYLINLPIIPH